MLVWRLLRTFLGEAGGAFLAIYGFQKGSPKSPMLPKCSQLWFTPTANLASCSKVNLSPSYPRNALPGLIGHHGASNSMKIPTAVDASTPFDQTTCGLPPASP